VARRARVRRWTRARRIPRLARRRAEGGRESTNGGGRHATSAQCTRRRGDFADDRAARRRRTAAAELRERARGAARIRTFASVDRRNSLVAVEVRDARLALRL